jgi:putative ABC transport system permease protein
MLATNLKLATRNLTRHRVRTAISLAAVAFGVASLLLAGGFTEYMFWAMRESSIQSGLGHIQVSRPGFRKGGQADPTAYRLPARSAELGFIRTVPGVRTVEERLRVSGLASSGDTTVAFQGEAIDPNADKVISQALNVVGETLTEHDTSGVILGRGLATALGVARGDRVVFLVTLPSGGINGVEGHVRGLFSTGVKAYDDSTVRMPLVLGRQLLKTSGSDLWVVALNATEQTEEVTARLRSQLPVDRFEVASWLELSDFYRKAVVLLSRQIDVVGILVAMIIVFGIANTITMNVLERTGEIGTLMAMGTSRGSVMRLFVIEAALIGICGGLAGIILGLALAQVLSYIGIPMPPPPGRDTGYSARIIVTTSVMAWAFLLSVAASTVASIRPAWKAARLPIVDSLRFNR